MHFGTLVDFVHRTAFDFLQDPEQGGAFLRAFSAPQCIPQTIYLQVHIAELRLFGIRDKWFRTLNDPEVLVKIMHQIWHAEYTMGVSQKTLCGLVDTVVNRINRNYEYEHTGSHWSARWGHLQSSHREPSPIRI